MRRFLLILLLLVSPPLAVVAHDDGPPAVPAANRLSARPVAKGDDGPPAVPAANRLGARRATGPSYGASARTAEPAEQKPPRSKPAPKTAVVSPELFVHNAGRNCAYCCLAMAARHRDLPITTGPRAGTALADALVGLPGPANPAQLRATLREYGAAFTMQERVGAPLETWYLIVGLGRDGYWYMETAHRSEAEAIAAWRSVTQRSSLRYLRINTYQYPSTAVWREALARKLPVVVGSKTDHMELLVGFDGNTLKMIDSDEKTYRVKDVPLTHFLANWDGCALVLE